jgi:hypothetical protein
VSKFSKILYVFSRYILCDICFLQNIQDTQDTQDTSDIICITITTRRLSLAVVAADRKFSFNRHPAVALYGNSRRQNYS